MNLKPINQQVVVVVGCTSGIGLETARQFAEKGAILVLAGRGQEDLFSALNVVRDEGSDGIIVEADVTSYEDMKTVAQRAEDTYGRIDTWAHVAGAPLYTKVEDVDPEDFRRVLDVNLTGPMHGILAALPHLKREGRGALIIVSSVDARVPLPYQGPYVASKQGLQGLIDTLRIELKHDGYPISLTNIKPATISTPFFEKAKTNLGFEPGLMPPIYSAKSVADAIVYAAEHPIRTINVGGASSMFQISRRISPRMTDAMVRRVAFKGQETDIPKGPDAPNNLYAHVEGYNRVEGKAPGMYSKATWLELHPPVKWALRSLLLVGLPIGAALFIRSRRHKRSLPARAARASQTVREAVTELASAGVIAGLLSRFQPRKPGLRERLVSGAQDAVDTVKHTVTRRRKVMKPAERLTGRVRDVASQVRKRAVPVARDLGERVSMPAAKETLQQAREHLPRLRHRQSTAEKLMSKVQDILPKGIFVPERESLPRQALKAVKDFPPKLSSRTRQKIADRVCDTVDEAQEYVESLR